MIINTVLPVWVWYKKINKKQIKVFWIINECFVKIMLIKIKAGKKVMKKIFLIEDDEIILNEISQALIKWNYEIETVNDWENIANEVIKSDPDLITMDITLPSFDGFYWTQQIRRLTDTPIIFLTAENINDEGVRALEVGANDFIEKPFSLNYLIAKINLLLQSTKSTEVEFFEGNFQLNSLTNTLKLNGHSVRLTPTETIILKLFFTSSNKILSRKEIIKQLWDNEEFISENTLDVNISRLRRKLSQIDQDNHIITVHGKGYQWKN